MNRFKTPLDDIQEMMASLSNPLKGVHEAIGLMSDPLKEHREMMASLSNPLKEAYEAIGLMSDPLKEHREMMASLSNPFEGLRAISLEPFVEMEKIIADSKALKSFRDIAFEAQEDMEIGNGLVTLSSKCIPVTEIQALASEVFYNSSLGRNDSFEETIYNLLNEIRSQKDPLTQRILICFVYPLILIIIASILNPVAEHYVTPYLKSDKVALTKELKASINSVVDDKDALRSIRYVSADILNVRNSASIKSETIGYLRFASVVLIIEKRKNWTLVEWNNPETNATITGWVFSRYLVRFK